MTHANTCSPIAHGSRLGFKISLSLICVYAVGGTLVEVGRQIWLTHELRIMLLPIARLGWAGLLPVGFLLALGPALALGTLTGAVVGELWRSFGRRIDGRAFALLVLVLCAGTVVGLHVIFHVQVELTLPPLLLDRSEWPSNSLGLLVSYPSLVGVPSIVYVLTGAWGSYYYWLVRQRGALAPH